MIKIQKNKSLKKFNTWKINSRAKYFCEVETEKDFLEIFDFIKKEKIKYFILGGGSNVVFLNDFYDGLIIKIKNNSIELYDFKKNIEIEAGVILDDLVKFLQQKKIYNMANLTSIPGTVSGAIFGNAGAYGLEIGELVQKVLVFDLKTAKFKEFSQKACNFSYRNSIFKQSNSRYLIYKVFLKIGETKKEQNLSYTKLNQYLKKKNNPNEIRKEIEEIRKEKFGDLNKIRTTGSIFKNAEITNRQFKNIQKILPDIPFWDLDNGKIKIPTGYLLDKLLNIKGKKFGNIKINKDNALVFYATVNVTGKEIFNLIKKIKKNIKKKVNINITSEVIFIK